jgi:hypothetical protein
MRLYRSSTMQSTHNTIIESHQSVSPDQILNSYYKKIMAMPSYALMEMSNCSQVLNMVINGIMNTTQSTNITSPPNNLK